MAFLNEDIRKQLTSIFEPMKNNVEIALFLEKTGCETCEDTKGFVGEIAELSDKISLKVYDLEDDSDKAGELGIDKAPGMVLLDSEGNDKGVKFFGIPAGHEVNSFIGGLLEMSGSGQALPEQLKDRVGKIDKKVNIKVFVTLGCPHCPGAVLKAHKLAMENPNITAEMIEANTFEELSRKFQVSGVPKIVFNDGADLLGDQPLDAFLQTIENL